MSRRPYWLLLAGATLFVTGCSSGSPVNAVTGTVTLDDKPLAGAEVLFWPKTDMTLGACLAVTDQEGRFEAFPNPNLGMTVWPGRYVVLVAKYGSPPRGPLAEADDNIPRPGAQVGGEVFDAFKGRNYLPPLYNDKNRSPFTVDVQSGPNEFSIALKSRPKL